MEILGMAGHLIRRLNQISTQVFAVHMQEAGFDLTPVQFAALDAIHTHPGVDQARIAALIAYDRATIGGVIDRLDQKALVTRSVSPTDRRARVVSLTDKGEEVYAAALPIVAAFQGKILDGLSPDEQEHFLRLAEKTVLSASDNAS